MLERMIEQEIPNHFDGLQIRQHSDLHGINFTILHGEQLTLQSLPGQDMGMIVPAIALSRDRRKGKGNIAAKIVRCFQVRKTPAPPELSDPPITKRRGISG